MTGQLFLIVVLVISVVTDFRYNKIYNSVTATAILAGLIFHIMQFGSPMAFYMWLASCVVPFLIFLPFYALGGMSAGDVKLIMACGALLGWPGSLVATGLSLIFGSVLGLIYCLVRGGFGALIKRVIQVGKSLYFTGRIYLEPLPTDSVIQSRFPYALAIAAGSFATMYINPS